MDLSLIGLLFLCYIIGSVPTAFIIGRINEGGKYDIRQHGSGNSGATNVYRNLGILAGIVTLLFDAFKGYAVVHWMPSLYEGPMEASVVLVLCAAVALLGHTFPVFIGFKGGKGVATTVGIMIAFNPYYALGCAIFFLALVLITKQAGIGSIVGAISFPLVVLFLKFVFHIPAEVPLILFSWLVPIFILLTHRSNIQRIIKGENKKDF